MDTTNSDCRRPTTRPVESGPEPAAVERDEPDPLVATDLGALGGHCGQTDLWGAIRDLFEGPELVSRVRSVLDPLGADYVYLTERKVADSDDRRQDLVQPHHPIGDATGLTSKSGKLVEAYNGMNRTVSNHGCPPPGSINPGSALNRFVSARMPMGYATVAQAMIHVAKAHDIHP